MPKKSLGQNFLTNIGVIHRIVDHTEKMFGTHQCDTILEIGPGKGALTKQLIKKFPRIITIEKDLDLQRLDFFSAENIIPIWGDVLTMDFSTQELLEPSKTLVMGNLPYYITSPILTKFFGQQKAIFPVGIFMIQKEVADKIITNAKKKSYLRWMLNFHYEVKPVCNVSAKSFYPAPNVDSTVIALMRKEQIETGLDFLHIKKILDYISGFKRKTLGAISKHLQKNQIVNLLIPTDLQGKRLEELSFVELMGVEVANH